ncbi:MAG: magnesium transporter CorA family protein [Ilumatobacteraceae bacterium]
MGACRTHTFGGGGLLDERGTALDQVSELLQRDGSIVWIDLDDPSPDDLTLLAAELGLHQLSVEDALESHQRVHYEHHVFLVCHAIAVDIEAVELDVVELDVFIGNRWFVTTRRGGDAVMDRVAQRWEQVRRTGGETVGFAIYALLDVVVDDYFATLDALEKYYHDASDRVFNEATIEPSEQRQWFEMRRALNQFQRTVGPLSDALDTVVARDLDRFEDAAAPYLRDVQGELARAASEVTGLQELVRHIVDMNLLLRDFRQNAVMKKVTSWAAIIAVPTLVTGWYGMNVPYPGSGEPWGVVSAAALALGCSGGLWVQFRRRGWL